MLFLYSGTPGSGKSLHAARTLFDHLSFRGNVITNFDVNKKVLGRKRSEKIICCNNSELNPGKLSQISRAYFENHKFKEGRLLLLIDEAQLLFNAREWGRAGRAEWLAFFTNHRKFGYDIILIAQFDRMIDRQIRSLIEYEYKHRKVSNYGAGGRMMSLVFGGKLFVSVKMWYPLKEKVGSEFFGCKKRFTKLYDTYQIYSE